MTQTVLNVPLIAQQTDEWCWAASGEMVMSYEGDDVSQCEQANYHFSMSGCCDDPTPTACVQPGYPDFGYWGFSFQQTAPGVALTFAQLTSQFASNLPVAYSWRWTRGGGHMMVAIGVDSATTMVYINNPWPPNTGDTTWITYSNYVSQSGVHTHGRDWYDITPSSPPSSPPGTEGDGMTDESPAGAPGAHDEPYGAAAEGLRLLPRLATRTADGVRPGGSPAASAGAQLSDPFRVFYVYREVLAERVPGDDPRAVLVDVNELLYPVLGGGEVIGAVRVVRQDGAWTIKSVGEPNLARSLVRARARDSAATNTPAADYLIVHVPALYQMFVGRFDAAGTLMLSPVHDDAAKGFSRAETLDGAVVLDRLVPQAQLARDAVADEGPDLPAM